MARRKKSKWLWKKEQNLKKFYGSLEKIQLQLPKKNLRFAILILLSLCYQVLWCYTANKLRQFQMSYCGVDVGSKELSVDVFLCSNREVVPEMASVLCSYFIILV